MMVRHLVVTFAILLLAFALGANVVDVKYDYDHNADFSRDKTYSWAKVETPDSLWNDRVQQAVDKVLSAKGLTKVPDGGTYRLWLSV
jgi:uncharacterized protein DUF4136